MTSTAPAAANTLGSLKGTPKGPLLITGLTLLPDGGQVLTDGALVIDGGRLTDVGPTADVRARHHELSPLDASGYVATAGLVNAHTHAAMGFFRGLGHGRDQMIESFLIPAERSLTEELLEPLAYSYLYGCLVSGVTTVGEHYYFAGAIGRAIERLGMRGVIGETIADLGGAFPGRQAWESWRRQIDTWPYSSLITPAVAPHAADTVSAPLLAELAAFAKDRNLPLHMHLSQTTGERERVRARAAMTPVAYAARAGALGPRTLAVHLVTVDADDIRILQDSGATAGLCPASQIIYERLAPLNAILEAGIPAALGTDCAASNDGADLLAEMRILALLGMDRGVGPGRLDAAEVYRIATANGAHALGLGAETGRLAPGLAADIVFLKRDLASEPSPRPDMNLIFSMSSRNVRHVMIAGRFVLQGGRLVLVDESELAVRYTEAVQEINRRLGRS